MRGRSLAVLTLVGALPMLARCSFIEDFGPMKSGECENGQKACPTLRMCVPLDDPATGCGNPVSCKPCEHRANTSATLCQSIAASGVAECAFACSIGWQNCDGNPVN